MFLAAVLLFIPVFPYSDLIKSRVSKWMIIDNKKEIIDTQQKRFKKQPFFIHTLRMVMDINIMKKERCLLNCKYDHIERKGLLPLMIDGEYR